MKHSLLHIFLLSLFIAANCPNGFCAQNSQDAIGGTGSHSVASPSIIDQNDTVTFDLSQAVLNGNILEFPVTIKSDDAINALDFSFQYDHSKLLFDTIINRTTYMSALSFYSASDSTVRFTSNSSHVYTNDTVLAIIRFTILTGPLDENDIVNITTYLNGDPCSVKVTNYSITYNALESLKEEDIQVFPNPVTNLLYVHSNTSFRAALNDVQGKNVIFSSSEFNSGTTGLDLSGLAEGVYFLSLKKDSKEIIRKIVVGAK